MPADFAAEVRRLAAAMRRDPRGPDIAARLERFDGAVLLTADDGRYLAANQRALQLTGYDLAELVALTVADVTPVPYAADYRTLWREFLDTGRQKGTYQLRRRDGSVVQVHYAAWANIVPGVHITVLTP